jgi:hypothetical protein
MGRGSMWTVAGMQSTLQSKGDGIGTAVVTESAYTGRGINIRDKGAIGEVRVASASTD